MASQPNDNTAAAVTSNDIAPALFVLRALLLEVLFVDVVGEVVGVEFVNSRHDAISASSDLLWQHLSIVQKPASFGIGWIHNKEVI